MKTRILLINPWIYDFAATNLWARPLGLLRVAEYLSQFDVDLSLIDCLDVRKAKIYGTGNYLKTIVEKPQSLRSVPRRFGRYGIGIDDFRALLIKKSHFDLVLITSIMSYWYPGVQMVIETIRSISKDAPIILGGIYATLWHQHASHTSGADFIYKGHIKEDIKQVFNTFGFRIKRKATINHSPSPLYNHPFAPILTSTGCPYRCSYCASHLLTNRFTQRNPRHVLEEIKGLYDNGIRDFAFYDDALFINADFHIKLILKEIIKNNPDIRFHCPNGLHARFIDDELANLMKHAGFKTLRLSLETANEQRQKETGGKVSSEDITSAVKNLKKHGFTKDEIGIYLMYGLPGQSLEEIKNSVEFVKSLDVKINLTEFSPIPETECWKELLTKGVISENIDPLLTNNTVFSYLFSGYDREEFKRLKLEVKEYNIS